MQVRAKIEEILAEVCESFDLDDYFTDMNDIKEDEDFLIARGKLESLINQVLEEQWADIDSGAYHVCYRPERGAMVMTVQKNMSRKDCEFCQKRLSILKGEK